MNKKQREAKRKKVRVIQEEKRKESLAREQVRLQRKCREVFEKKTRIKIDEIGVITREEIIDIGGY